MTSKAIESKYGHLKLQVLSDSFKYVLFENTSAFWAALDQLRQGDSKDLWFPFHLEKEVSMILPERIGIKGVKEQLGWRALRIIGEMPFGTVQGLIAKISGALIQRGLGVCIVSTYLTDVFFIKADKFSEAAECLRLEGWEVLQ